MKQFMKDRNVRGLIDRHARGVGFAAFILILAFVAWDFTRESRQNKVAIEKSCVLMNNAIIRATTNQGKSSKVLVDEILRNAREHHRGYVIVNFKKAQGGDPNHTVRLLLVDCEEVAQHPGGIKAEPIPGTPSG
jgi:hypothetical protein